MITGTAASGSLLALIASFWLAGCASTMFDAPPEEPAQVPVRGVKPVRAAAPAPLMSSASAEPVVDAVRPVYADVWMRLRAGFALPEAFSGRQLLRPIANYRNLRLFERLSPQTGGFLHYVIEQVEARQLPLEVALLPFVESGYSLNARSEAQALGAWQFIEETARKYSLTIDRERDDRYCLIESTRAALDYLTALHAQFGDWPLAFAAYNVGEKRIQAEVDRLRAQGRAAPGFSDIAPRLPKETQDYVPRLYAIREIVRHPSEAKVALAPLPDVERYRAFPVDNDMDIDVLARLSGVPLAELRALNPSYRGRTLWAGRSQLLLPAPGAQKAELALIDFNGPWRLQKR